MKTINPGKQRKRFHNASLHKRKKWMAAHLDEELLLKYDKRSIPIVKGDTVKIMRGSYRGHEDKIAKINIRKNNLEIEGITMTKADGNKIAKPIHPSNVIITKLNLTDKWRRTKLESGLSEETRKEIEKEAKEQIQQVEDEQKRIEEEKSRLEEVEETDKIEEKEIKHKESKKEDENKTKDKQKEKTTESNKKKTTRKTSNQDVKEE
jgi:large subunit ribosomal protein L24